MNDTVLGLLVAGTIEVTDHRCFSPLGTSVKRDFSHSGCSAALSP
jgi:hypothetical protein